MCLFIIDQGLFILSWLTVITQNQWLLVFDITVKQFTKNCFISNQYITANGSLSFALDSFQLL